MSVLTVPSGVSRDSSASSFSRTSQCFSSCRGVSHIPTTGTASWGGSQRSEKEKLQGGRLGCCAPTLIRSAESRAGLKGRGWSLCGEKQHFEVIAILCCLERQSFHALDHLWADSETQIKVPPGNRDCEEENNF